MGGIGTADLRHYRQGKRLTRQQAIHAKCSDCCCDYADGRVDCGVSGCPLHPFHPYLGSSDEDEAQPPEKGLCSPSQRKAVQSSPKPLPPPRREESPHPGPGGER
jgi:hypothetical protein